MLLSSAVLLLAPAAATAKLWGWPDSFTVSAETVSEGMKIYNNMQICSGWGNWCGQCDNANHIDDGDNGYGSYFLPERWHWINLRKDNSAWVDFWRQGDSDTFNMYESNQDGTVHGQCQIVDFHGDSQTCSKSRSTRVLLNCWQW